ncbi:MAG: PKD domain-containing protein [Flavobacteriales bacterium]
MRLPNYLRIGLFLLTGLLSFSKKAEACHAIALVNPLIQNIAGGVQVTASSDSPTCGCGAYWLDVEVRCVGEAFDAAPFNPGFWGPLATYPYFQSAQMMKPNCVVQQYPWVDIPFSGLCPGSNYQVRMRENHNGQVGPWSPSLNFTVPGTMPTLSPCSVVASSTNICVGDCVNLTASISGGCGIALQYNWSNIPVPPPTPCNYSVCLEDWNWTGFGWEGGSLTVNVGGVNVLTNIAPNPNTWQTCFNFSVLPGQTITFIYYPPPNAPVWGWYDHGITFYEGPNGSGPSLGWFYYWGWQGGDPPSNGSVANNCVSPTNFGSPNQTACPITTTTYDIIVTDLCSGQSNTCAITVNVLPPPVAGTASISSTTICSGQTVNLSLAGHAGNVQWQSAPNAGGPWTNIGGATNTPHTTGALANNACFRAEVTGCGVPVYTNVVCVTVNPIPTASINSPTICAGQSATLTSNVNPIGGTYSWAPGGQTSASVIVSPAATTNYTLTYTLNGCPVTASGTVTVNPLPTVAVNSPTICTGGSTTLTATPSVSGGTYSWSPGGQTTQSITVSPGSTTTYTVTYTLNGCSNTGSGTVTVNPIPTVTVNSATICAGTSANLTATPNPAGGTYSWAPGGQISQTISVSPGTTTNYTVTYTLNGCSNTGSGTVTVNTPQNAGLDNNATLCNTAGSTVNLNTLLNGNTTTGTWAETSGSGQFNAATGVFDASGLASGTYNFTYTVTSPAPCTNDVANFVIQVNAAPSAGLDNNTTLCNTAGAFDMNTLVSGATGAGVWVETSGSGQFNAGTGFFNPSGLAAGNYTFTYTVAGAAPCPSDVANFTVAISTQQNAGFDNTANLCNTVGTTLNLNTLLNGNTTTGTWAEATSSGQFNTGTGVLDASGLAAGTYTFTYTVVSAAPCINDVANFNITIQNQPTAGLDNTATLCNAPGSTLNLNTLLNGNSTTGTWAETSGSGQFNAATGVFNAAGLAAGTYTFTYAVNGTAPCINDIANFTITVTNNPNAGLDNTAILCNSTGSTINLNTLLSPAADAGGTWSQTSGAPGLTGSTFDASGLAAGNYTFNYMVSGGGTCLNDDANFTITVNNQHSAGLDNTATLCNSTGATLNLNTLLSGNTTTGTWIENSGSGQFNAGTGVFDANGLAPGAYNFTYTVNSAAPCVQDVANFTITVNSQPNAGLDNTGVICNSAGSSINLNTLLSGADAGGTWTETSGSGQFNAATGVFDGSGLNAGNYTFTYTVGGIAPCVQDVAVFTVSVNNQETAGLGNTSTLCNTTGSTLNLNTLLNGNSVVGTWVETSGSGQFNTGTGVFDANGLTAGTYNFTYTVNSTAPCVQDLANFAITVNYQPTAGLDNTGTICNSPGSTINLNNLLSGADAGGTWAETSGSGQFNAGTGVFDGSGLNAGNYTFTYTINGTTPCVQDVANFTITINNQPNAGLPNTVSVCQGTVVNLFSNLAGTPDAGGTWADDNNTGALSGAIFNTNNLGGSSYNFTYTVSALTPCVPVNATVTVEVFDSPLVSNITEVCNATNTEYTLSFEINGGDATSYQVVINSPAGVNGTIAGNTWTSDLITSGDSYSVTITDVNNCAPITITGSLLCSCATDAGTMNTTSISLCENQTVNATHNGNHVFDGDDAMIFVLHTNNSGTLGTIIATNSTPSFGFAPPMTYGTTYYVSAVAGNDDGVGGVDLSDPCLDIANGTPVVWYQNPDAAISGSNVICLGDQTALTFTIIGSGPFNLVYTDGTNNFNANGISTGHTINVSPSTTATYSLVSVADAITGCVGTVSGSATITVNEMPTVANITTTCNNTNTAYQVSFEINGGDPATYNVVVNSPLGISGTFTGNTWTSDLITSGASFDFSVDDANSCGPVVVTGQFTCACTTDAGSMNTTAQSLCDGDIANATHNGNHVFDGDDTMVFFLHTNSGSSLGTIIATNSTASFGFAPPMAYGTTYYISAVVSNNDGAGGVDLTDPCLSVAPGTPVVWYPYPDATITPTGPFCTSNTAITLSAATTGGTWAGNGVTDPAAGIFNPATSGVGIHNITYTITVNGCTSSDNTDIEIIQQLDATITQVGPYCTSDPQVNLNAIDAGGLWAGNGIVDANLGTFDPSIAGPGSHEVSYSIPGQCGDNALIFINVSTQLSAVITPLAPFCTSDNTIVLNAVDAGGIWSGNGITNTNTGLFDPAVAGAGTHTITYDIPGQCGDVQTTTIVVNQQMNATITPVQAVCLGQPAFGLTTVDAGGTWSGNGVNPATGVFDPATAGIGQHHITYTIGNPCGDVSTITIEVTPNLNSTITQAGPFCEDANAVTLVAATAGGTWSGNGITNTNNGTFNPAVAGSGLHTITYSIPGFCGTTSTIDILVNALPSVNFSATPTEGCSPVITTFTNNNPLAGSTCLWNFGDGTTSVNCGAQTHTYVDPGCYNVTLIVTSAEGCANQQTQNSIVCVSDNPIAAFTANPEEVSYVDPTVNFTNQSIGASTYYWEFNDGNSGSSTLVNPTIRFDELEPGTYNVCLWATTSFGCVDSTCSTFTILPEFLIYVPNSFTPNGDGVNDIFLPNLAGIDPLGFEMFIFNRWGELIFTSNNPMIGWDGTHKGQIAKVDTYVWKINVKSQLNAEIKEFVGHINLLK